MTFLFFGALVVVIVGFSEMNWLALALSLPALAYSIHQLDKRQQAETRAKWAAWDAERMARGNGHPKGNVQLIVKSEDR